MKAHKILKDGKKSPKKFFFLYFICIFLVVISALMAVKKVEDEKPNAIDLSQTGGLGTETEKYVYLRIDELTDAIAVSSNDEDEKYYLAISDSYWYVVRLSKTDLEELKDIQAYTYGEIDNKPASVTVYGITEEVPEQIREYAVEFFNEGLEDDQKITVEDFESYFGSVMLDTARDPVDLTLETVVALISIITLIVGIILQMSNKFIKLKVFRYLEKNNYEKELEKQLEDSVEETFFNDKLIITKDFLVDTTKDSFVAVKFLDIKWIYTHRLKYYGVVSISNNIIVVLKDAKTQLQFLDTNGKISDEFEKAFDKICEKLPSDSLKGYTQENITEFKEYKRIMKINKK